MGKVYSTLTRPVRMFNIMNRAERVISREKPTPAPQYAAAEKQRRLTDKVNPRFLEEHYQKNAQLDRRLKDVFVTSTDPQEIKESTGESKPLPQERRSREDEFLYEPYESTAVIPIGKCSLRQALTFLLQHKRDPVMYNSENIASEYKMDKKVVDDILKYFKVYVVVSPNSPQLTEQDPYQEMIDSAINITVKKKKDIEKKK